MIRTTLILVVLVSRLHAANPTQPSPEKKWQGQIPRVAQDEKRWQTLLIEFLKNEMYYSALATAYRMPTLFNDLPTKEKAYQAVVQLIDMGFKHPIREIFSTADIDPSDSNPFVNSYLLYKGMDNKSRGMQRWAQYYFERIDRENFPKIDFYEALQSYETGNLIEAETKIKKLLGRKWEKGSEVFISKIARTLARIYFEKSEYPKALDIYDTYLLKLNPINTSDWLEASWSLYHLKRYDKALGYLYNLEAPSSQNTNLEKYVLRALIYRALCSTKQIDELLASFESQYNPILEGIKGGVPLRNFSELKDLAIEKNSDYLRYRVLYKSLGEEVKNVAKLPNELQELAKHFYSTEAKNLATNVKLYEEEALSQSAEALVGFHENIKFLKFEVARVKYSPENVFSAENDTSNKSREILSQKDEKLFEITWKQHGDYWRDERLRYKALVTNECGK